MVEVPFCDTPGQSVAVGALAGVGGGLLGTAAELEGPAVVALAAGLALVGELVGHVVRGDDQFRAAVRQVRGDG